jgi:predicted cobalt transporter CbtA
LYLKLLTAITAGEIQKSNGFFWGVAGMVAVSDQTHVI